MTTEAVTGSSIDSNAEQGLLPFVLWGVGLWVVATVVVRLAGGFLLDPSMPLVVGVGYILTVPAMAALAAGLLRFHGVRGDGRGRAVAALLLPVVVLDTGALLVFGTLFPNLGSGSLGLLAAWLLVAYAGVLLAVFVPRE